MKKGIICFVMIILLVFSTVGTVFAADTEDNYEKSDELGPNTSVQFMYAKLQLEMAQTLNQQAMDKMENVMKKQEEQKQVSAFLNTARQCKSDAQSTGEATEMPSDMAEYMKANELAYDTTGDDLLMTGDEWDTAIGSLESRLAELATQTQQLMVYVQDYIKTYNSYVHGTGLPNPNAHQTNISIARGQSMYGDSEVGLAVTGLVVGLVLGCLITFSAQSLRRKKDKA